jgi:hypothetical protein
VLESDLREDGILKSPWEFHSDLSLDRLQQVAEVLRTVRRDAILVHDPVSGDTPWILGCRIYGRSAEILTRTGEKLWNWFRVVSPPLEFVFSVGAVPLRFCRDDADRLCANHLRVSDSEALQLDLAFGDNSIDLIWRMVVETNSGGETEQVVLIGSTAIGDNRCQFVIPPIDGSLSFITTTMRSRVGPGVELPPPIVKVRETPKKKDAESDKDV